MNTSRIAAVAVIIVGAVLRLHQLTLRPFHHDEGVNGFFLTRLVREGYYKYDPSNYHGPSLYYLTVPLVKLFGLTSFALRFEPAIFGIALIAIVFFLGRRLGDWAAVAAAAFIALSPGMLFFSRYYIHEMMLLFCMLGLIVSVDRYCVSRGQAWLFSATASAAMMFATKETAAPMLVVLVLAWGCAWIWMKLAGGGSPASSEKPKGRRGKNQAAKAPEKEAPADGGQWPHTNVTVLLWMAVVFVAINLLLYTSFYTNRGGLVDAFKAFAFWTKTGESSHVHPVTQYLTWMMAVEPSVLVLGFIGVAFALARRPNTLVVFCAFWALGMLSMYSLIAYKTPWLTINIVLPMAVMSGYAAQEMFGLFGRPTGAIIVAVALAVSGYQAWSLNFEHYDDNRDEVVYVYAHTVRDVNRLLADINRLAERDKGLDSKIAIVAPTYWPLPWYLRDYKQALFHGKMAALDDASMAISEADHDGDPEHDQDAAMRAAAKTGMQPVGTYTLRPGVTLVLWAQPRLGKP